MNRRLLPLNALRAFEVSARQGNLSKAAEELGVTHSAVSQQVRQLEGLLGVRLFHRTTRGVRLTEPGQTLLPILAESFDRMGETLEGLVKEREKDAITVTTTPSFATKWLMPRLRQWRNEHLELAIHLLPTLGFLDLRRGEADVGIRCGRPPWKGLKAELVSPIHLSPVCSPALLGARRTLRSPQDSLKFTLIHADIAGHELGEEWKTWFAAAGLADPGKLDGLSFHDPNLALQAAIDGLGIAIGYSELAEQDIATGRLVYPFDLKVRHAFSYYLVYPTGQALTKKVKLFRKWVLAEAKTAGSR